MDVNGHKHDGDVLLIEENELMKIRCLATNELGTGQSNLLFPDDMHSKCMCFFYRGMDPTWNV